MTDANILPANRNRPMSNPLLKPEDPRFKRANVRDGAGRNPFAERDEALHAATNDARPFAPRYAAQQPSRAGLFLFLGGMGWGTALVGCMSIAGLFDLGWISPLLGVGPAAAAWLMARNELQAIDIGAMDPTNRPQARQAFWLGLTAFIACLAVVTAMIYRHMNFLPAVF
jgi:hypothetical protein